MKYLKTINELFDSQDIKDQMEIPHLKGEISYKELVKDDNLIKDGDSLLARVAMNCPYISNLGFTRLSDSLINIGFFQELEVELEEVIISFHIEIMEHKSTNRYLCNAYATCMKGNKKIYNESINRSIMPYDRLIDSLNNEVLNLLIDFNKFTLKNFNYKGSTVMSRDYMSGLALGRN